MAELQAVIINGVVSVLVVLIGVVFTGLKEYIIAKTKDLKIKKTTEEFKMLKDIVLIGVNAVEQISKTVAMASQDKMEHAVKLSLEEAQRRGLYVSKTQLEPMVEAFVKEMNDVKNTLEAL